MITLAVVAAAAVLLSVVERLLSRRDLASWLTLLDESDARHAEERRQLLEEFARERAELLIRIQHPGVIVPPRVEAPATAEPEEVDELELVGTVVREVPVEVDEGPES